MQQGPEGGTRREKQRPAGKKDAQVRSTSLTHVLNNSTSKFNNVEPNGRIFDASLKNRRSRVSVKTTSKRTLRFCTFSLVKLTSNSHCWFLSWVLWLRPWCSKSVQLFFWSHGKCFRKNYGKPSCRPTAGEGSISKEKVVWVFTKNGTQWEGSAKPNFTIDVNADLKSDAWVCFALKSVPLCCIFCKKNFFSKLAWDPRQNWSWENCCFASWRGVELRSTHPTSSANFFFTGILRTTVSTRISRQETSDTKK